MKVLCKKKCLQRQANAKEQIFSTQANTIVESYVQSIFLQTYDPLVFHNSLFMLHHEQASCLHLDNQLFSNTIISECLVTIHYIKV